MLNARKIHALHATHSIGYSHQRHTRTILQFFCSSGLCPLHPMSLTISTARHLRRDKIDLELIAEDENDGDISRKYPI